MNLLGVPDLLTSSQTSRSISNVSQDLARVSQELSSGLNSNIVEASGGDPGKLYAIERELRMNEVQKFSIAQAKGRSGVSQAALEQVQSAVGELGAPLLASVTQNDRNASSIIASGAHSAFSQVISSLNSQFGDRSLFAGAATDGPALASADDILSDLATAIAGAADAGEVLNGVNSYFSDPAGFQATGFLGSGLDASNVELDNGETVTFAIRADAAEILETLSALAIAVIGAEGGFVGDTADERQSLLGEAGRRAISANEQIIELKGELGIAEERFDEAPVRIEAEEDLLQQARSSIAARDPFEAAVELSAIETQVQAVFSITARLSGLTLTNLIR